MRAIVVEQAGAPDVLAVRDWPKPEPKPGWVLIKVKGFGLNRSELYTRQGHSPSVKFPRVLGIECVGEVEAAPGSDLAPGARVAAVMGGMGRDFDGGYQEFALLPASQVMPVHTSLDWQTFAALPETYLTAWRGLHEGLEARSGEWLLIRGGTSSVGMATLAVAKSLGMRTIATTRNPAKEAALREGGADHVVIDTGSIAGAVREIVPAGVDRVLELIGTVTLKDSLQTVRRRGVCCYAGLLGNEWVMQAFSPMEVIPNTVRLTIYTTHDVTRENSQASLQRIVDEVAAGRLRPNLDKVFRFDEIAEAHRYMEANRATGKVVVMVD